MKLYTGIDLHSNNSYVAILDEDLRRLKCQRLPNDLTRILDTLEPYRDGIEGIAVESTYNWYWLVDGLMEAGYRLHLVNTSAVVQYEGLKHVDDQHDACWLAQLLKLGILPEGYIYPKERRGFRDLLRRRSFLVRQRTANLLSLKNLHTRHTSVNVTAHELRQWDPLTAEDELDAALGLSFSVGLNVMQTLDAQIRRIEEAVLREAELSERFKLLKGIRGVGDILAMTIMYEVGDISRFAKVGNFASYCRCVSAQWTSNGKRKGTGNSKNGNAYLSWAFIEAAHFAIRYDPKIKSFYERKKSKTMPIVAMKAVANKLARASYYVLRDQVPFEVSKAFG